MGWSIHLSSNKEITEQEIESIVNAFPPNLKGAWSSMGIPIKNSLGGWNAATDISQPCGNSFSISGSYSMSGHIAEEMSHYLKSELEKTGHRISIDSHL